MTTSLGTSKLAPNTPTSIQTVSGIYVDLLRPTSDSIKLSDIVTAAARIKRFTGHSHATLAEHSCRVHDIVKNFLGVTDPRVLRAALLHDAHEVYVGDCSSPLKIAMRSALGCAGKSDFDWIEAKLSRVVAEKFEFDDPHPAVVKEADIAALAIEADATWGWGTAESWGLPAPINGFDVVSVDIVSRLHATYVPKGL